jgi:hypothetical protein
MECFFTPTFKWTLTSGSNRGWFGHGVPYDQGYLGDKSKTTVAMLWCPTWNIVVPPLSFESEHEEADATSGDGSGMNTGHETREYFDWPIEFPPEGYAANPSIVRDTSRGNWTCGHSPGLTSPSFYANEKSWGYNVLYLDTSVRWWDLRKAGWPNAGQNHQWTVFDNLD